MSILIAFLIAVLFSCATFLILQQNLVRVLFGFGLLTHAANLLILAMSGSPIDKLAPIVTESSFPYVDPIPQALILTAIVIGFGVTVYLVVLLYRIFLNSNSTDQKDVYNL